VAPPCARGHGSMETRGMRSKRGGMGAGLRHTSVTSELSYLQLLPCKLRSDEDGEAPLLSSSTCFPLQTCLVSLSCTPLCPPPSTPNRHLAKPQKNIKLQTKTTNSAMQIQQLASETPKYTWTRGLIDRASHCCISIVNLRDTDRQ
jgi:hypothetical protein